MQRRPSLSPFNTVHVGFAGHRIAYIAVYTLIMHNDALAFMIESRVSFLFFFNFPSPTVAQVTRICFVSKLLASLIQFFCVFLCAVPATLIQDNVCFNPKKGPFKIKQEGELVILRVDYKPSLPDGEKKTLVLSNSDDDVVPEYTTSDNIHFDFRFDSKPYPVTAGQTFYLHEKGGSSEEICVTVYGYYAE